MKHTFLRPAAFLLAAGLLFCTLFAPAAAADEQKDLLSSAVSSAKSQYEQEQNTLQELQNRQQETEQRITQLEGRAGELQAQLAEVTDALQQAQTRLSEALAAEDAARRALAAKQAEYEDALARCKNPHPPGRHPHQTAVLRGGLPALVQSGGMAGLSTVRALHGGCL